VDKQKQVIGVLAPGPQGKDVAAGAADAICDAHKRTYNTKGAQGHGKFAALHAGVSFSGGQKVL
jgi:hypothetical protein